MTFISIDFSPAMKRALDSALDYAYRVLTDIEYDRGLDVVRLADRQAAHVRFAAIAVAAGLTAFLLAVVAGVIV